MHVGRDDESSKNFVDHAWDANIRMIKHRKSIQNDLKTQHSYNRCSDEHNHKNFDEHRKKNLHRMKPEASCDIKI